MSDIEEVVIPKRGRPAKDTKPEIAREKLKEKRDRLKKEKDNQIIEEAKKRLIIEAEEKAKAEAEAKRIEEEKKKNDPNFMLLSELAALRQLLTAKKEEPKPVVAEKPKRQYKKKTKTEVVVEEIPKTKPARKPRNRTVYEESPSNNFVGSAPEPPAQYVQYTPTNPLLNQLLMRRNMNSFM